MKIIQITAAYKPAYIYGGPTMSVAKLCEILEKINEQEAKNKDSLAIEVFTTTANGKEELDVKENQSEIIDGVQVTYFTRLTKDHTHFSPRLLFNLFKVLRQAQHDKIAIIIHIHAWWNLVSVLSCAVAKWYKIPVILSPRGMLTNYTNNNRNSSAKKIIHKLLGKKLLSYCHIHATSEQEKKDILSIIKPKSITVIPNLVELGEEHEVMSNEQRIKNKDKENFIQHTSYQLIFLSRIEEKKGLELLFAALAALKIDWKLTIAGSGDEDYVNSLKLKAESLKITDKLSWIGHVNNENKFKLLANHDLMVLTSYNENFANVVVESLSVGTPVLLSDHVGLADYIIEKNLGWVSALNANGITDQLSKSYADHTKRMQIKQSAPQLIKEDFNDKILVNKYINLYKNLVDGSL